MFKTNVYHKTGRDRFEVSTTGAVDLDKDFELIGHTTEQDPNEVFRLFNTVDYPFWLNPEVELWGDLEGARSLSVRDVIQTHEGDLLEVAPFGFNKVHWTKWEAANQ